MEPVVHGLLSCTWDGFQTLQNVSWGQDRKKPLIVRASSEKVSFPVSESRAANLRRLLEQPGIRQAPACYDALSASLVEKAGFDITFMSGRTSVHL